MSTLTEIYENMQKGKAKMVKKLVPQALEEGFTAQQILNEGLLAAMDEVGVRFRNNEVFVPEVLVAARAMNAGVALLKPYLADGDASNVGKVVIGTVQGDLHDIGKNLVRLMMEGKGIEVIDLGVDVAPEQFVQAAIENDCGIIACSALLTTTMPVMGEVVKEASEITADRDCIAAAKIVVFCNAPEDNPFMAGAFHGVGEADCVINVGVSGPGVVRAALEKAPKDLPMNELADLIKRTAFKITRMGQLVGTVASERLNVPFGIVDLSLAPTPAVGDSVAYILEEMGLETCGAYGTTACLAMLNDAVKKGGVMASSSVGGLSGAFIPVSEDAGMIHAAREGVLTLEKLEAMTAVCSVGLDMVVVPGDVSASLISGMIADEAAIGMVNSKTTAVRVIPAIGHKEGEELNFGGLLGAGPVMHMNPSDNHVMIDRGGRIPAPLQSLKN